MNANRLAMAWLTCFGLGYLRPAPGTWGSLPPVALVVIVLLAKHASGWGIDLQFVVNIALIALGLIFAFACLKYGTIGEERFGGKDPSSVVADEVAGQSLALLFLPWREVGEANSMTWNVSIALIAFISFRVLDITKPPPARQIQNLPGGMGILLDDVIAGLYALGITQIAARFLWPALL